MEENSCKDCFFFHTIYLKSRFEECYRSFGYGICLISPYEVVFASWSCDRFRPLDGKWILEMGKKYAGRAKKPPGEDEKNKG